MPLTKPAISARDAENKERELINQFLKTYFNGTPHDDDAGVPVTFPLCAIEFNQTDVRSLDRPLIHWTFATRTRTEQRGDGGMIIAADTLSTVYAQTAAGGLGNSADHLCAEVASHIAELFDSRRTVDLAAKGIRHARVVRGPVPMNMPGLNTRMLVVKARIEYTVPR